MIHIYTGTGKGKTTAALGLATRAAGHGFKVRIIQFLKGSTYAGELRSLERLGIEVYQFGRTCPHAAVIKTGFLSCQKCGQCWIKMEKIQPIDRAKIDMGWQYAQASAGEGTIDLLILDEIINAVQKNLIPLTEIIDWLVHIPPGLEVVLTGRNAPGELIELADYATELQEMKHPYRKGVSSRRGIEY